MVMLKMERAKYNGRAPPGRLEEIMRQHTTRIMKMDRNNRTVLMRALYADFCAKGTEATLCVAVQTKSDRPPLLADQRKPATFFMLTYWPNRRLIRTKRRSMA